MTELKIFVFVVVLFFGGIVCRQESPSLDEMKHLIIEYFQHKNVPHLVYIRMDSCGKRLRVPPEMTSFVRNLIKCGFYVQTIEYDFTDVDGNWWRKLSLSSADRHELKGGHRPEVLRWKQSRTGIIVHLLNNCSSSNLSMEQLLRNFFAPENNYFTVNNFWMMLMSSSSLSFPSSADTLLPSESPERTQGDIIWALKFVFVPPDSQVVALIFNEAEAAWDLIDLYRVARDTPMKTTILARNFTRPLELHAALVTYGEIIPKRRQFEGISLRCGVVIQFPDIHTRLDNLNLRHIDTIAKVNFPITTNLAEDLDFRFDLVQVNNFGWNHNGTFDGLMGSFQRLEVDFGANAFFMRLDRIGVVDFTSETVNIRAALVFRQPPLSAVSNIFAMPFDKSVWIIVATFLIIATIAMLLQIFHPNYRFDMHWLDCFVFAWGAICQQGFYISISSRSGRIVIFITFVTSLFLYTSYSANIVALLQSPSESIRTIEDLLSSPMQVEVQDTFYNKVYFNVSHFKSIFHLLEAISLFISICNLWDLSLFIFLLMVDKRLRSQETKNTIIRRLFANKIKTKGEKAYVRPEVGIENARRSLYAYQVETHAAYYIVSRTYNEHEKCGLKELELFKLPTMAIPVRKKFPYKEIFRQRLRWQREVGLINREAKRWFDHKPNCENGVAGFVSIGIMECRYALEMFGIGCVISIGILLLEVLYNRLKQMI